MTAARGMLRWATLTGRAIAAEPFEAFFVILGLMAGVGVLAVAPPPASLDRLLPMAMVTAWGLILVFGCSLTLIGLAGRRARLEVAGLSSLAAATLVYVAALLATGGIARGGLITAGIYAAGALACAARAAQLLTRPVPTRPEGSRG